MSRHTDDNLRWVLIEPGVIARVDGTSVNGLMVYGNISAQRLRGIRLSRLDHIGGIPTLSVASDGSSIPIKANFPEWQGETPPSPKEVLAAEKDLRDAKVGRLVPTGRPLRKTKRDAEIRFATTRLDGESTTDFYRRFAAMVLEISTLFPSPSKEIAEATGLSPNTIKQYMLRARRLGFLPPSRRGQK